MAHRQGSVKGVWPIGNDSACRPQTCSFITKSRMPPDGVRCVFNHKGHKAEAVQPCRRNIERRNFALVAKIKIAICSQTAYGYYTSTTVGLSTKKPPSAPGSDCPRAAPFPRRSRPPPPGSPGRSPQSDRRSNASGFGCAPAWRCRSPGTWACR